MVNALDLRKPGQGILYRPDGAGGAWRSMLLSRPLRQKGPDCWLAQPVVTRCDLGGAVVGCLAGRSEKNGEVEIYLSDATKDEMWRLV